MSSKEQWLSNLQKKQGRRKKWISQAQKRQYDFTMNLMVPRKKEQINVQQLKITKINVYSYTRVWESVTDGS